MQAGCHGQGYDGRLLGCCRSAICAFEQLMMCLPASIDTYLAYLIDVLLNSILGISHGVNLMPSKREKNTMRDMSQSLLASLSFQCIATQSFPFQQWNAKIIYVWELTSMVWSASFEWYQIFLIVIPWNDPPTVATKPHTRDFIIHKDHNNMLIEYYIHIIYIQQCTE